MQKALSRLLVLVLFFSVLQSFGTIPKAHALETTIIPVAADTFVDKDGGYPTGISSDGGANILFVGYERDSTEDYGPANAALKFQLNSIPGTVQSATLNIYIKTEGDLGDEPYVDLWGSNDDSWQESTTVLPSANTQIANGVKGFTRNAWKSFPVTGFVQSQLNGDKVASFVMKGIQTNRADVTPTYNPQIGFADRIDSEHAAYLEITYNPNSPPTDLSLSGNQVAENKPVGEIVGTLSATDPNAGETFTYSIVGGDADSFSIQGNQLKTTKVFDYETKNAYNLVLRVTDSGGLTFDKSVTIQVTNVAPTIALTINGGAQVTGSAAVTLSVSAAAPENTGLQMRFSNGVDVWSEWEPFAVTKPWVLGGGDGGKTVYLEVKDSVATVNTTAAITLDTTPPAASLLINGGALRTNSPAVSLAISASDPGGGSVDMRLANDDGAWGAWEPLVTGKAWNLSSTDGTKKVSLQVRDRAGNLQKVDQTIELDTVAPVVTGVSDGQIFKDDVTIVYDEGTATLNGTVFVSGSKVSEEGSYRLIVTDGAGNATTISFAIDRTSPQGTLLIENGAAYVKDSHVALNLDTGDAMQMRFSNDQAEWSDWETAAGQKAWVLTGADGTKTVFMELRDQAGNVKQVNASTVLDTTAPTGAVTINGGAAAANARDVALTITTDGASDMRFSNTDSDWSGSDWEPVQATKAWTLAAGDGVQTVYMQVRDEAGNIAAATDAIMLDTTVPIVAGVADNGLYNDDRIISFNEGSAELDGEPFANGGKVDAEGSHTLIVTDEAGNVTTIHFRLDKTPPAGTIVIEGGKAYTNSPAVTVSIGLGDATDMRLSSDETWDENWEPAAAQSPWTLPAGDGRKTVYLQLRDEAGNVFATNAEITLDTVVPVVTGVEEGKLYNSDVTIFFNEGEAVLDGQTVSDGDTIGAEGPHTLVVTDQAGNATTRHFAIDKTPPSGTIVINGGKSYTKDAAVTVAVTMSADTDTAYLSNNGVDWSPIAAQNGAINWNVSAGDGAKTVFMKLIDKAGNEASSQATIELDTEKPTGSVVINDAAAYTALAQVSLAITADGAAQMRFSNDNAEWSEWEDVKPTKAWELAVGDGSKTVYAQLRDQAENETVVSDAIELDTTAPVVTGVTDGGVYNSDVSIAFNEGTATLNGEPFDSTHPVSADRGYVLIVTDAAGNKTTVRFAIDKIPPNGSFAINDGALFTSSQQVTLHVDKDDASQMRFSNDGTAWSEWEPAVDDRLWTLAAGDGDKTVYMQLRDPADNLTQKQAGITLDTMQPSVSLVVNNRAEFTSQAAVTASVTASDGSGAQLEMRFSHDQTEWSAWEPAAATKEWTLAGGDGLKTIYLEVRDPAGNTTEAHESITLDTRPPEVSGIADGAYYKTDPTISFHEGTAVLDGSPIASEAVVSGEGAHTLVVTDRAGNTTTLQFTLDKTAPTGSMLINGGRAQTSSRAVSLSLVADDNIGPVELRFSNDNSDWSTWNDASPQQTWTLDSGDGVKTVYAQLRDRADNVAELSATIRLDTYIPPVFYPVTGVSLDETKLKLKTGDGPVSLHAAIEPAYASNQTVFWNSSDPAVAEVNANGVVTVRQAGKATVTVTTADGNKTASCLIVVEEAEEEPTHLEADEPTIRVKPKKLVSFSVYAVTGDEQTEITRDKHTSYSTSNKLITVTPGRVRAGSKTGQSIVTVRYDGQELEIPVTISNAKLASIEPSADRVVLEPDEDTQLTVSAVYQDESSEKITAGAKWSTDSPDVVEVSQEGKLTAKKPGAAIVMVEYEGKDAEVKVLVVTSKFPTKLEAERTSIRIKPGETYTPVVTAVYGQNFRIELPIEEISWTPRNSKIAVFADGQIKGVAKGTTTIMANYRGKRLTFTVTVR